MHQKYKMSTAYCNKYLLNDLFLMLNGEYVIFSDIDCLILVQ